MAAIETQQTKNDALLGRSVAEVGDATGKLLFLTDLVDGVDGDKSAMVMLTKRICLL